MKARPPEKILNSLKTAIGSHKDAMSLADASTKTGLSLLDTKSGLNFLIADFRGALAATSTGELLYSFPTGFTKPWEQSERLSELWKKFKKTGLGILKFIVRAWISIVMVAYVVIFALIILALTFSKSSDRDEGSSFSGGFMFHMMFRLILDSLFWTFHPFSPFRVSHHSHYGHHGHYAPKRQKTPFYERVNRFFFGPEEKSFDTQEAIKLTLQEIRAKRGRIGILDVMRVTGLSKEEADPFMAKLMLNHDGDVLVSEAGGIYYQFESMRVSALRERAISPSPIWQTREVLPPFTGNTSGSNMLIAGLNGFNLMMSMVAISSSWTIEKLKYIFMIASSDIPLEYLPPAPEGTSLLLGWIPLIFSSALFLIPISRAVNRPRDKRSVDAKNGKRGLLRTILTKLGIAGIKEKVLFDGWTEQANAQPSESELTKEIIHLGGEMELRDGETPVYRFAAIEAEIRALEAARKSASMSEVSAGEVVFSSAK